MMPFWMGYYHHAKTQAQTSREQCAQQRLERELELEQSYRSSEYSNWSDFCDSDSDEEENF